MFTVKVILDMISGKRRMYRGGACFGTQDASRLRPEFRGNRTPRSGKKKAETVTIDTEEFLRNMSK